MSKPFLSPVEYKLLIFLSLLICSAFYISLLNKAIEAYNESVRIEQITKKHSADPPPKISIAACEFHSPPPFWYFLYWCQFITFPLLVLLIRNRQNQSYIFSVIITSSSIYCFINWVYRSFDIILSLFN